MNAIDRGRRFDMIGAVRGNVMDEEGTGMVVVMIGGVVVVAIDLVVDADGGREYNRGYCWNGLLGGSACRNRVVKRRS